LSADMKSLFSLPLFEEIYEASEFIAMDCMRSRIIRHDSLNPGIVRIVFSKACTDTKIMMSVEAGKKTFMRRLTLLLSTNMADRRIDIFIRCWIVSSMSGSILNLIGFLSVWWRL
jgi:hypothetical protein